MKKMHVYEIYTEDNEGNIFKFTVPAFSKKEAIDYVSGNGEIITVKDSDLQDIDLSCLAHTLDIDGWGKKEIDIITRCLTQCGLDRII